MIILRSAELLVRVDPSHGGEILDLVDLATGRQLLGRPPFASLGPLDGELDEDSWTARYRGGWQTVTPNAGNACSVDGEHHGFHGRASAAPWAILEEALSTATLRWSGRGLDIERSLAIVGGELRIETGWTALRDEVVLVAVEHLVAGVELLAPAARLRLPGGAAFELSEADGPIRAPAETPGWPSVLLLDGSCEDADEISLAKAGGRFFVVESLPKGWYELVNSATGQGLRVEWDVAALPHLWVWREVRMSGGRWRCQAELLGLEPASVPHSLGLARAHAEGQAVVLDRGARFHSTITAAPFRRP